MSFLENILLSIFSILIATVILVIILFKRRYGYWKYLGLEYVEPEIPFGNIKDAIYRKTTLGEKFTEIYSVMKARKVIHAGGYFFNLKTYIPIDLDLIKHIMQVDFAHFTDHGNYVNEKGDPLSAHLFALSGHKWRNLRAKLTPTFTSGKMKNMLPIMVKISQELVSILAEECQNDRCVEVKDISARFTTDVIGSCAFGIDCNSLKDPDTEFRVQGKRLLNLSAGDSISNFLGLLFPKFSKFLGLRVFPKTATNFFWNVIKGTVEYREQNGVSRSDLIQLLLDLKNNENKEFDTTLTFNELAAQAFGFFFAGFETSSTLMSFALMELAINENIQATLRNDINTVLARYNNDITYDVLRELPYLDMVLHETLRKYPPIPMIPRVCTKDYRVPNTDVVIPKEMGVFIPVQGIHYDPEYYPDPETFDPTRFNEENKSKRHQYAYLPFGEGPRVCLGLRFGMMQAKVGLIAVIRNFKVKVNSRTETPLKLDPSKFFTTSLGGLWIDLERIA